MAVDTTVPRSRRALLAAALGGMAASAAHALGRPAVTRAADDDPILAGNTTTATQLTALDSTGAGLQVTAAGSNRALNVISASGQAFQASTNGVETAASIINNGNGLGIHVQTSGISPAILAASGAASAASIRGYNSVGTGVAVQGFVGNDPTPPTAVSGAAIQGNSDTGPAVAAKGGTATASAVDARNVQNGTGLLGVSGPDVFAAGEKRGIHGYANQDATARGVLGSSQVGRGVHGVSTSNTGVHGQSTSATGVVGSSTSGRGVLGTSSSSTLAAVTGQNTTGRAGVQGIGGSGAVPAGAIETGVHGVSNVSVGSAGVIGESAHGTGVAGLTDDGAGLYGEGYWGLYATGAIGVTGDVDGGTGVQGWTGLAIAPAAATKVGVWAGAEGPVSGGRIALFVNGQARFTRSGRVAIPAGKSSVVVTVPGGLTSSSFAIATPQTNRAGVFVQSVVPSAATGKITIFLNKIPSNSSSTTVGWIVIA